MKCRDLQSWLRVWDLERDLSDDAALHLDGCPECLTHFNLRFLPISAPVPQQAAAPRFAGFRSVATLAAAALLLSVMPGRTADAASEFEQCDDYHRSELSFSIQDDDIPGYCEVLQ